MPWAIPPWTWPSTIIGFTTLPKSSTAVKLWIFGHAAVGIDLDLADVHARRIGEVRRVVVGGLFHAGLEAAEPDSCAAPRLQRRSR